MKLFLCSHFSSVGSLIKEEIDTKKAPPAGAPFAEPRFMQYRTGTMYVRAIRKKQRQGITMIVVSCLFRIWDGLSAGGMV